MPRDLDSLIRDMEELREQMRLHEMRHESEVEGVAPECASSGRNLLHYLGLRQHDLRPLQRDLAELGLSSLGRSEPHALASVDAVLKALRQMAGRPVGSPPAPPASVDFASGPERLARNARDLLGEAPVGRDVRIMVTLPSEAAEDYALVRDLVAAGMDIMRINAAHDGPDAWRAMCRHLEQASREEGRPVRSELDLAGPKLRTGDLEESARLVRWRIARDVRGRTLAPARIWLAASEAVRSRAPEPADAALAVDAELLGRARVGDVLEVDDARGRRRRVHLVGSAESGWWGECERAAFVEAGATLRLTRDGHTLRRGKVGDLPPIAEALRLERGDALLVCAPPQLGRAGRRSREGEEVELPCIPCTLPEVFADVRPGERVLFDDGKLASVIRRVDVRGMLVEITHAPPGGMKLGADKGINLPDSELRLPSLTSADLENLDFAIAHADLIGQSFVRGPDDVRALQAEIARRGARLGVLVKIETRAAFETLPRILLAAMATPPVGVMVARGDLAVELGYERLAEVQEEILWLCEAAHLPVVWATQVLESLSKTGQASRAEVTDAAMGGRAECVMLNKGPYVVNTVRFLSDVLHRMKLHQEKKRSMLRRLSISSLTGRFLPATRDSLSVEFSA